MMTLRAGKHRPDCCPLYILSHKIRLTTLHDPVHILKINDRITLFHRVIGLFGQKQRQMKSIAILDYNVTLHPGIFCSVKYNTTFGINKIECGLDRRKINIFCA